MDDVDNRQQVSPPEVWKVTVVKRDHRQPVMTPLKVTNAVNI
jgi:hypothetical protein